MAVSSDVRITQDGRQVKLHPYLAALVRWCVSCVWSSATLLLHRLMTTPLPQITAPKPSSKPREASNAHLHPEPKVECSVLRVPETHNVDVIFVHGLYGSLGNTWRQGDWRSKYSIEPNRIPLRRSSSIPTPCTCDACDKPTQRNENNTKFNQYTNFKDIDLNNIDEGFYKDIKELIPNNDVFVSENFYEKKFYNQVEIVDSYESHADFVRDLFEVENDCDFKNGCAFKGLGGKNNVYDENYDFEDSVKEESNFRLDSDKNANKEFSDNDSSWLRPGNEDDNNKNKEINAKPTTHIDCICKLNKRNKNIDIRNKAIQDSDKNENIDDKSGKTDSTKVNNTNNEIKNTFSSIKDSEDSDRKCEIGCGCVCDDCYSECWPRDWIGADYPDARVISINYTSDPHLWRPLWVKECKRLRLQERAEQMTEQLLSMGVGQKPIIWVGHSKGGLFIKEIYCEAYEAHMKLNETNTENDEDSLQTDKLNNNAHNEIPNDNNNCKEINVIENAITNIKVEINGNEEDTDLEMNEDNKRIEEETGDLNDVCVNKNESSTVKEAPSLAARASLWCNSAGFMFYSVPHRGSPLADIKTPLTARSIELLEISKDCALVVSLQNRWLAATSSSQPVVRSLVETCRTLMAVLWLRIVSVDSADPGIGALCGVSVDHREICKPTSRHCLLYTELTNLMRAALNKCKCQ